LVPLGVSEPTRRRRPPPSGTTTTMTIFFVPSPTWFVKLNAFESPSLLSANREMKDAH
jgi:hypothetical protein